MTRKEREALRQEVERHRSTYMYLCMHLRYWASYMEALKKVHGEGWKEIFSLALDDAAKEAAKYMLECLKRWTSEIPVGFIDTVDVYLKMLRDMGVVVTIESKNDEECIYRVVDCPVAGIVDISPEICECEIKWAERLLSIIVGKNVSNEAPMRIVLGSPYCKHVIKLKRG